MAARYALGSSLRSRGGATYANLLTSASGLQNYFPFGEPVGTTIGVDRVRGQQAFHTNVLAGQDGLIGPAVSYDGISAYSAPRYGYSSTVPTTLTLDAWVRPSDVSGGAFSVVARGDLAGSTLNYQLGKAASGSAISIVVKLDATTYSYQSTDGNLEANAWQHVALQLVGGQAPQVYRNGVRLTLDSGTVIPLATLALASPSALVRIGATGTTPSAFAPARIQQVSIANTQIAASNLLQRYNTGLVAQGRTIPA